MGIAACRLTELNFLLQPDFTMHAFNTQLAKILSDIGGIPIIEHIVKRDVYNQPAQKISYMLQTDDQQCTPQS